MRLLIAHGRTADEYLVRAARVLGHEVHLVCNLQERPRLEEVKRVCQPDYFVVFDTRYDKRMSQEDYLSWYKEELRQYILDHRIQAILPGSSIDLLMKEIGELNDELYMPGIKTEDAEFFRDKTVYLPALAEKGVRVPKIHEIVEPGDEPKNYEIPYPALAKPGLGCGGYGIYVADNEDKLRWFFGPSDNVSGFSERALFYQDRDLQGAPKNYVHFGFGGRYLVQHYLEGPIISLAGTAVGGVPILDMAYDIAVTPPPYCSEVAYSWPSAHPDAQGAAVRLRADLEKAATFPDGAWMADAILHEGELWLIDLSCRMSSSGTKLLYHAVGDNPAYAANVISSVLYNDTDFKINPKVPTHYEFLPFPKGRITNIKYPTTEVLRQWVLPQDNVRVFEMRNDVQVSDRGWIVTIGEHARDTAKWFISGIGYDVE